MLPGALETAIAFPALTSPLHMLCSRAGEAAVQLESEMTSSQRREVAAVQAAQAAWAALDRIDNETWGEFRSLEKVPAGAEDVSAAIIALLSGAKLGDPLENGKDVDEGKFQDMFKDISNMDGILVFLKSLKDYIDKGRLPVRRVRDDRFEARSATPNPFQSRAPGPEYRGCTRVPTEGLCNLSSLRIPGRHP